MTTSTHQARLYVDTVRRLRASQVIHRIRLRAQRRILGLSPISTAPLLRRRASARPGWPNEFLPIDLRNAKGLPNPHDNARGLFEFLNERHSLGDPPDWNQPAASLLWRYNLNYFEWAWGLAAAGNRKQAADDFESLWRSWVRNTRFGRGVAWAPYVASLRTWVLCGIYWALVARRPHDHELTRSIAEHAGYVRANIERDVGGNHLIKNLKALIGAAVFLDDQDLLRFGVQNLTAEIPIQILDDGGHYERSPHYHCQVLGDLLDIAGLLEATGRRPHDVLTDGIEGMRYWLGQVLMPDGDVPLFNDSVPLGPNRIAELRPEVPASNLVVLPASGYVAVRAGENFILIDVGQPCPRDLPAHAHSDCLSFELSVGGRRMLVNSGVSTYEAGTRRSYERSTRAHNTLEIDGRDQTETWAAFRAGRRANALLECCRQGPEGVEVVGSHDGYQRLSGRPLHTRTWTVSDTGVHILDEIAGSGVHDVAAWLHIGDGSQVEALPNGSFRTGGLEITVDGANVRCELIPPRRGPEGWIATGFGVLRPAHALVARSSGRPPLRISTTIKTLGAMPTNTK